MRGDNDIGDCLPYVGFPDMPTEDDVEDVSEGIRVTTATDENGELLCNQLALQRYILHCCQDVDGGGMRGRADILAPCAAY